jgi:iron complex transport system ATP-binding protein
MAVISVRDISFAYNGPNVFENISFNLEAGEILCLFGPNGCGKTTLLDNILGHLRPGSGSIIIDGMEQSKYRHGDLAKKIAYVPQSHEKTFPYRVLDIVVMGRTPYISSFSSPGKDDYALALDAMEMTGITHLKDRIYTQLSGGETQLVILARALAQDAPVIIMDEPASHLDFRHELELLETVAKLVCNRKLSIIMSTHSPNHAFHFENKNVPVRIALMNKKKFTGIGKPGEVLTETQMKNLFSIDSKVFSNNAEGYKTIKYVIPLGIIR